MGQGKIAKSYGLQMANLSVLCLRVLEQGKFGWNYLCETGKVLVLSGCVGSREGAGA